MNILCLFFIVDGWNCLVAHTDFPKTFRINSSTASSRNMDSLPGTPHTIASYCDPHSPVPGYQFFTATASKSFTFFWLMSDWQYYSDRIFIKRHFVDVCIMEILIYILKSLISTRLLRNGQLNISSVTFDSSQLCQIRFSSKNNKMRKRGGNLGYSAFSVPKSKIMQETPFLRVG